MSVWKTVILSLLYFIMVVAIIGIISIVIYLYHQAHGNEVCNAISLMILCQGIGVYAAIHAQKFYFRIILKLRDFQMDGDTHLIMMDKLVGNVIVIIIILFVAADIIQLINGISLYWIFCLANVFLVVIGCGKKTKLIELEGELRAVPFYFNKMPYVIQRLLLAVSPWLAALAGNEIIAKVF